MALHTGLPRDPHAMLDPAEAVDQDGLQEFESAGITDFKPPTDN
jgi:hypothetical protein